ncbi:MAG: heterocyst frequency control protein PatD [Microcoleaceae cyanobacterium]
MLTDFNFQIILQFQESLKRLQTDLESEHVAYPVLQSQWHEIEIFFEQQIMTVNPEAMAASVSPIWQSYLTEIHKQMRLLTIDLRFLKAARQSTTAQTRQIQILARIGKLMGYCDAILVKFTSP